jgi:hypothetical protein
MLRSSRYQAVFKAFVCFMGFNSKMNYISLSYGKNRELKVLIYWFYCQLSSENCFLSEVIKILIAFTFQVTSISSKPSSNFESTSSLFSKNPQFIKRS